MTSIGLRFLTALLASLLALAAYWPALDNGFVWDDRLYLFNVEYLDSELWKDLLRQPFFASPNYYRPLPQLSFVAQIHLQGLNAFYFHLVNVGLHAFNSFLIVLLAFEFLQHKAIASSRQVIVAGLAGTLYAWHPALVESVAWVSGRFDVMVTSFLLLALMADTLVRHPIWRPLLVGLSFFAAATCKEAAIAFPFVLFAWHLAISPRPLLPISKLFFSLYRRGEFQSYLTILAGGVIYLILRYVQLGYVYQSIPNMATDSGLARLLLIAKSIGFYGFISADPFALISPVHPRLFPFPISDPWAWTALVAIFIVCVLLVTAVRKMPRQGWLWVAFFAALVPVIHILPMTIGDNIIQERFMTFPLALFALALVQPLILVTASQTSKLAQIGGGLVLASFLGGCVVNVGVTLSLWSDDLKLWKWAATRYPDSATAHANLSETYKRVGKLDEALTHGLRALEINPNNAYHFTTVGNALSDLGRNEEALEYHQMAIMLNPAAPDLLNNAAITLLRLNEDEKAEPLLKRAVSLSKWHRRANLSLACLYLKKGDDILAEEHLAVAKRQLSEREQRVIDAFVTQVKASGADALAVRLSQPRQGGQEYRPTLHTRDDGDR